MADLNKTFVIGRLVKDCEQLEHNGNSLIKFSIAVNKTIKKGENWESGVFFINNLVLFGKRADGCKNFLVKGRRIAINGHLDVNEWEDKNGKLHSELILKIDDFQLLDLPKKSEETQNLEEEEEQNFNNDNEIADDLF